MSYTAAVMESIQVNRDEYKALQERANTLESLLQDCMSTMDNCHAYDTEAYHNASNYLYGEDDE
ncbi:hypothetical protein [Bacillus cereus]|uniref:hypothetical protein n=1 Tax=Bacillus cereus group TaxID=86661 RepID=UPI001BA4538F|nr:hypothetical protein [Bacillus cereus]MBR9655778.1 hypothetical protein [Bacillus cereus]